MDKKSLKEVFEFFPNAKWITQDSRGEGHSIKIWEQSERPEIHVYSPNRVWDNWSVVINIYPLFMELDWGHRRTWKSRIVSREEVVKYE